MKKNIICLALLAVCFLISCKVSRCRQEQQPARLKLISISNGTNVTGSFFLGCGSINGEEFIYAWAMKKDGGIERLKANSSYCTIYMDAPIEPYAIQRPSLLEAVYDFHVPPNTIIQKYELK